MSHRIEHRVMIINLVAQKSAVECFSLETAQRLHRLNMRLGESEVPRWRRGHLERLREVATLLPDVPVIANEHCPKITNRLRVALADSERSCLHIIRVGGVKYCDDRRIVELGRAGLGSGRCDR